MKICIIGGGAAGMMAAITAKRFNENLDIEIIESNDRLGKKLLATGNGRCNFTNSQIGIENFHGRNRNFANYAISNFSNLDSIEFFKQLGIEPFEDERGRLYPNSLQAASILDVLRYEINRLGIKEITGTKVIKIIPKRNRFLLKTQSLDLECEKLLLAGGGLSMPKSGSDGNCYRLARELGHKVFEPKPAIVQLNTSSPYSKSLDGVKIISSVSLINSHGEILDTKFGDILFTKYGISGPTILDLSRLAIELMEKREDIYLSVNLVGDYSKTEIQKMIEYRQKNMPFKSIREALIGLINKRLIVPVLKEANIVFETKISDLNAEEFNNLLNCLYNFNAKVTGSQGFGQAQTTNGGISTDEINEMTMESKIIDNLFFAGEIIDIDGDCGGYNLQWAWSSGYICGKAMANLL